MRKCAAQSWARAAAASLRNLPSRRQRPLCTSRACQGWVLAPSSSRTPRNPDGPVPLELGVESVFKAEGVAWS